MSDIRVTKERIDHLMETADYVEMRAFDNWTIVAAQLENGFVITKASACVDSANYDHAYGVRLCKDQIRQELWELEGYALQKGVYKLTEEML